MKNTFLVFVVFLFATSFSSCVILSPKKYKALLASKDSLYSAHNEDGVKIENLEAEIGKLKKDTSLIAEELRALQISYNDMEDDYKKLKNNSSTEITKLSGYLAAREKRLKEVEEVLRKREEATNLLKEKVQKALLGFTQNGLTVEMKNGKVYVSLTDKLLFPSGSIIIDEKGKQALEQLAKVLKEQPEINIAVEGHTDNQKINNLGQIKDNWDLSVLRATSVVRYLTEAEKIASVRMTATGRGEYQPLGANTTAESRSKNRRIEIVLSPKLDELYSLIK